MAQRNLRIEDELKRQIETVSRTRGYRSSSGVHGSKPSRRSLAESKLPSQCRRRSNA